MSLPAERLVVVDPRKFVNLEQLQRIPFEAWRVSCCCGWTTDAGDRLYGLELFQTHADEVGHEGDFAVMVIQ